MKQVILCAIILPVLFINSQQQNTAINQTFCYEVFSSPDRNLLWSEADLDMNIDWIIRYGDIIAYKIEWSDTGNWSEWFVTGVNDLLPANGTSQKRMWSLFSDHYHITIICKSNKIKFDRTNC